MSVQWQGFSGSALTSHRVPRLMDWAGLLAVTGIAICLRLYTSAQAVIWYDEAFSLLIAKLTPTQIWFTTARDVHPPLYYLALHYWTQWFGDDVWVARSLSAVADIGTLLLCIKLMRLVSTQRATWVAAVLLALLPVSVRYSQEIRMYTLLGFWLMGATVALVCWMNVPHRKRFACLYVLLMTAAFYTHYFAALCVLAHWVFWWRAGSGRGLALPLRAWLLVNIAIVALYLPWIPHLIVHLSRTGTLNWIDSPIWPSVAMVVGQSFLMISRSSDGWAFWSVWASILTVACAVKVILDDSNEHRSRELLVIYFFVPVTVLTLVSLITPVFVDRYILFAGVGLPMIVAVALDAWWPRFRLLVVAVLALCIIGEGYGLLRHYANRDVKSFRLDALAARLNAQVHGNDVVLFDTLYFYLPFRYYLKDSIEPWLYVDPPGARLWGYPDQGGWAFVPERLRWSFLKPVPAFSPGTSRVWWVFHRGEANAALKVPAQWTRTLTLSEGGFEARLYTIQTDPDRPNSGIKSDPP